MVWPSAVLIFSATTRATMSVVPPGAKGTTRRTGLVGYDWACATPRLVPNTAARLDATRRGRRFIRWAPRLQDHRSVGRASSPSGALGGPAGRCHTPAVPNPLLLLPDFLLILLGWLLCRHTSLDRPVWEAAERLVYYLLFPVLLFNSIVRSPLQPAQTLNLAAAGLGTVACGIVLALALKRWPGVDARLHASGAQTVFRFNSFIALALAERLGGPQGLAWMALIIALCVPLCNVAAVWPLARHGGHSYGRELLRNQLILSTLAGLVANLIGLKFPDAVATTL